MNLEATLETAADFLPEDMNAAMDSVSRFLPEDFNLDGFLNSAAAYIPAEIDFVSTLKFLFFFAICSMVMGILGRVVMGKRSSLNHAMSSTMGILFIYALTVIIYTFAPGELMQLLSPLPFVTFAQDYVVLCPVIGASVSIFCSQTLSLVILAFLVNLLDSLTPRGRNLISWYLYRFLTVALAMVLHLLVNWASNTYLPQVLVDYAPIILLGILASMLLIGVLNAVLGVVLTVIDPIFGGIYTFFFSNIIGKQITKAVFSTALICGLFILLDHLGYTVICITASALLSYIPLAIVLLVLWYLLGHVL